MELFILVFLAKCLSKCPNSTKPPLPLLRTWRKYFDRLNVRTLLGLFFCYRISTNPPGKITSWGRSQKTSRRPQDVPTWSHMQRQGKDPQRFALGTYSGCHFNHNPWNWFLRNFFYFFWFQLYIRRRTVKVTGKSDTSYFGPIMVRVVSTKIGPLRDVLKTLCADWEVWRTRYLTFFMHVSCISKRPIIFQNYFNIFKKSKWSIRIRITRILLTDWILNF